MGRKAHGNSVFLIDGENITLRFEQMSKDPSFSPSASNKHRIGTFLWASEIAAIINSPILRINYYTYAQGDEKLLNEIEDEITGWAYYSLMATGGASQASVVPKVFKKRKGKPAKGVDISLCVDALTLAESEAVQTFVIISGDGDYVPLIDELMRRGKHVIVAALSSGLSMEMKRRPDNFIPIDYVFGGWSREAHRSKAQM